MTKQQVQPIQQGGQTQQPTLPPLSEPSLFTADPGDLDFSFDPASGNFMLDFKKPQESQQPNDQVTEPQNPQQKTPDTNEDRFARIEGALINLAGVLQGIQTVQPTQSQQTHQTEQAPQVDLQSDDFATNLVNVINSAIEKKFASFEDKLKPLNTDIARVNERLNITDLVAKYGESFVKLYPILMEYKSGDPNANIEKLYLAMSKVNQNKPQDGTTRTTNGSTNNGQPQVDLVKKAEQMSTVRDGVSNAIVSDAPKGKLTIAQALDQTMKELFGR